MTGRRCPFPSVGTGLGQRPAGDPMRPPREPGTSSDVGRAAAWLGPFSPHDGPVALALAVLVVVSYFPALQGGFVWDDVIFAEEPVIHSPGALRSIWFAPADIKNEGHYWPLVYTSFWLEHRLWGLQPAGYHAVNLFLHLLNCLLLWRLLLRLRVPGALLIAAVFAVHPLHVESVAWIIERKDVLSALFYLGAVLAWLRFVEVERVGHYLLVVVLFTAGLLSKSVVVTLPLALLLVQWWRGGRVTRLDLLRVAPLVVLGVAITAADLAFYRGREPLELGYTLAERMLIAGRALWFYAGKLVWPVDLAVIYPRWEIDAGSVAGWGYVAAAAGLALALWLLRGRIGRGPLAGALYFALTLGPVLGFVDYGYMQFSFVADRFQYLAGIGVLAVLLGAAAHWMGKLPVGERSATGVRVAPWIRSATALRCGAWGLAVAVVLVLGTLTSRQASIYRDDITLFSHIVAHNPEARNAHLNLGVALYKADRFDDGLTASRTALQQRPESADALANVGFGLVHFDRFAQAEPLLRRALELDPRNTAAHQSLGEAFRELGRAARERGQLDIAAGHFRQASRLDPQDAEPLLELAFLLRSQQRHDEADAVFSRIRDFDPDDPETLHAIAESFRAEGHLDHAIANYHAAIRMDEEFAPAHAGLGLVLLQAQRYAAAVDATERALELEPELPDAGSLQVFIGRSWQELGDPSVALQWFERAVRIDALNPKALEPLAMAYFKERRYEEALSLYRTLEEIRPDSARARSNVGAALYHLGRLQEALQSFERALALDPDLEVARTSLAAVRKQLQQP